MISGTIQLPQDGSIVNPDGTCAQARVTVRSPYRAEAVDLTTGEPVASVMANEAFMVRVTAPADVRKVRLLNEYGLSMGFIILLCRCGRQARLYHADEDRNPWSAPLHGSGCQPLWGQIRSSYHGRNCDPVVLS